MGLLLLHVAPSRLSIPGALQVVEVSQLGLMPLAMGFARGTIAAAGAVDTTIAGVAGTTAAVAGVVGLVIVMMGRQAWTEESAMVLRQNEVVVGAVAAATTAAVAARFFKVAVMLALALACVAVVGVGAVAAKVAEVVAVLVLALGWEGLIVGARAMVARVFAEAMVPCN